MFDYIFAQWKKKKYILIILIICYTLSGLLLAIGIGISKENYNLVKDSTSGNTDDQLIIYMREKGGNIESTKQFINNFGEYGEVQILNLPMLQLTEDEKVFPVAVCYKKTEGWHIPLIDGIYLDSDKWGIVVGKESAKKASLKVGDSIFIKGLEFKVNGISGRKNRSTQWDETLYLKYETYIEIAGSIDGSRRGMVTLLLKSGKEDFLKDFFKIEDELERIGIRIYYQKVNNVGFSSVTNSVIMTVAGFSVLSLIILLNTINIMYYWFLERKGDIAVIKSMGANDYYLFKWLVIEMMMIIALSEFLANVIFSVIYFICHLGLLGNVDMALSFFHIMVSVIVVFVLGFIVAWFLNRKSIFADPGVTLKNY